MWIMFLHITIIHRHVYNYITLRHRNVNHISRLDRVLGFMYTQSGGKSNVVISGNFPNQIEALMVKSKDVGKSPINYKHWHFNGKIISSNEKNPASHVWRRATNKEPRNKHGWLGDCTPPKVDTRWEAAAAFIIPMSAQTDPVGTTAESAGNTANNT